MTTTAGAASELLSPALTDEAVDIAVALSVQFPTMECPLILDIVRAALVVQHKRNTPAPVTEGAQREAVAWMSDFSPDLVISAKAMREAIERGDIGHGFAIDSYTIPLYTALPPTDRLVKHMVNRFLGWRLPKPWHPDNGISYTRPNYAHPEAEHDWPTGTNLFDATQAEAMVRHMLEGAPPPPDRVQPERGEAPIEFEQTASRIVQQFDLPPQTSVLLMVAIVTALREAAAPAPPNDASGGVTREMVDAAIREIAKRPIPLQWPEDVQAVLEAADRARKPGYRQVTLEDAAEAARIYYMTESTTGYDDDMLAALQHIGAVIPDAGK